MISELLSMLVAASCAALLPIWKRPLHLALVAALTGTILGCPGVGLLGGILILLLGRHFRGALLLSGAFLVLIFFRNSSWGRVLGALEAIRVTWDTPWLGAGMGEWTEWQGKAQRDVLRLLPPWRSLQEAAAYFSVAPSLPAHLLAEFGIIGLMSWFGVLVLAWLGWKHSKRRLWTGCSAAVLLFWATSVLTTPVQAFLFTDREKVKTCDRAIKDWRQTQRAIEPVMKLCPDIRSLEWVAPALDSEPIYREWLWTFPLDVMPAYALGRLAAMGGDETKAKYWLSIAANGNPKRDERARVLQEEAKAILAGSSDRLRLWLMAGKPLN